MNDVAPASEGGLKVAYVSILYPALSEWYVWGEVEALRACGVRVQAFALERPRRRERALARHHEQCAYLTPLGLRRALAALGECWRKRRRLADVLRRILLAGGEGPGLRLKALLHTLLGADLALRAKPAGINHIHAHHGYAAAWAAMIAGRLLGVPYSVTLHGSDLLVDRIYLDLKVHNAAFVVTVSEHNAHVLHRLYPELAPGRIAILRLGVADGDECAALRPPERAFVLLAVGHLRPVKDHAFLVRACARLRQEGVDFVCLIAGDGPERRRLARAIRQNGLERQVKLLGRLDRSAVSALYGAADLVVLTSQSEGLPLVLMEAMAQERLVLAPRISGIPELVEDGRSGFLYASGDLDDFVAKIRMIMARRQDLAAVGAAARRWVRAEYDRDANLRRFCNEFVARVAREAATS